MQESAESVVPVWSGLSLEALEAQYNPRVAVPEFAAVEACFYDVNNAVGGSGRNFIDVAYGEHPLHKVDIYSAAAADGTLKPVHIFYHGGFWRAQDKANYAYVASALRERGITVVVANYELCPASTLDGVVASSLKALEWTIDHIADYGGDSAKVSISGASAGAHLCATILATDWAARGRPFMALTGASLISGIFDPEPVRLISLNQQLLLDRETAARHNVERRPLHIICPIALFVGGDEPWQWIDQTFRYSRFLRESTHSHSLHLLPNKNHFSIMSAYIDAKSLLMSVIAGPSV